MRRALALLAVLGAFAAATFAASPAQADPSGSCTPSRGVLVVVDFRHFGGPVSRGCAPSAGNGLDALHTAGYETVGTHHDGDGFVCRIDGRPTPAQDACFTTPPANAYWSYWHAARGATTWSYARTGPQSYHPTPGSVDAWVFGATDTAGSRGGPSFTPAQARAGVTSGGGATTRAAPPRPTTTHRAASSASTRPAPRASTPARPPRSRASAGSPARSASTSPSATRTMSPLAGGAPVSSAGPSFAPASRVAVQDRHPGRALWPVVLGLALAVLLGGGAGWTVLRRRRAAAHD